MTPLLQRGFDFTSLNRTQKVSRLRMKTSLNLRRLTVSLRRKLQASDRRTTRLYFPKPLNLKVPCKNSSFLNLVLSMIKDKASS